MHAIPTVPDPPGPDPRWPLGLEQEPPLGAHLTTSRRGYSHHGVYVGRGRVVHYSGLPGVWQCGPVDEVSLSQFAIGHTVRIVQHDKSPYSPEEIVRRARSRLGRTNIACSPITASTSATGVSTASATALRCSGRCSCLFECSGLCFRRNDAANPP